MSNIANAFKDGKAFIPFFTCGFPDMETSKAAIKAAAASGANLIELGIPFSDPTAEGPVIQRSTLGALQNGTNTNKIFRMVKELRQEVKIPLVFMTYANVVFSYGGEDFFAKCKEVGIDGIILPDLPYEEKEEFASLSEKYDVDMISMIAPTSKERIAMIAKEAKGFIYVVSSLGVTGVRQEITTDLQTMVEAIRKVTDVPCAIGFGIANPDQSKRMAKIADGVIVGSAIVKLLEKYGTEAAEYVGAYVKSMHPKNLL